MPQIFINTDDEELHISLKMIALRKNVHLYELVEEVLKNYVKNNTFEVVKK